MMENKKGLGALGWILIILILIVVGVIVYFLLTGNSPIGSLGGSSIPSPPALPA